MCGSRSTVGWWCYAARCSTCGWIIGQCIGWGWRLPASSTANGCAAAIGQGCSSRFSGLESGRNRCTRTATRHHTTSTHATNEGRGFHGNGSIGIAYRTIGNSRTSRRSGQNHRSIRIHLNRLHLRLLLEAIGGWSGQLNRSGGGGHATSGGLPCSRGFHARWDLCTRNHQRTIGQHGCTLWQRGG